MVPIRADWPAPRGVHAWVTTRDGGVSRGPYASLNLADHVGDDPIAVTRNREILARALALPAEPVWLEQVHGCAVADVRESGRGCRADAAVGRGPGQVCVVLTADCLPILLCDRSGTRVAAVHAGWRGLADGVLEASLAMLGRPGGDVMAWLGPAIGPDAFEVGDEVRMRFLADDPAAAGCFRPRGGGRWLADLFGLARRRLAAQGVCAVYGGGQCTVSDPRRFYSYRRDGMTGRMASLIWCDEAY